MYMEKVTFMSDTKVCALMDFTLAKFSLCKTYLDKEGGIFITWKHCHLYEKVYSQTTAQH